MFSICQGVLWTFYKIYYYNALLPPEAGDLKDRQAYIAVRIKQAREEVGFSQEDLGKAYGSSGANISQIERSVRRISLLSLERLANILGKPLDWFLSDTITAQRRPLGSTIREAQVRYEALEILELPVRGMVPAGYPFPFEQETGEFIEVPRHELGGIASKSLYASWTEIVG